MKVLSVVFILLCLFSTPALAQEGKSRANSLTNTSLVTKADFSELRNMGMETVDQIVDPLHVQLEDGRIVQLSSLDIPDFNNENPGEIAALALDFLRQMMEKKRVVLYQTKNEELGRRTRLGHYLGHLALHNPAEENDRIWIQGALIAGGLARIMPSERNTEMAGQMFALEEEAIREKRGLWADDKFPLLTPETAEKAMNNWGVVEGVVFRTAAVNNTVYLNFSEDWRKDFSIGLPPDVRRNLSKRGINALDLAGTRVRVHGWVESYNGPYIKLSDAAWLQLLPESGEKTTLTDN